MHPLTRGTALALTLAWTLACSGAAPEPVPAEPPWEAAWQLEHGAELRGHLAQIQAIQARAEAQQAERGDLTLQALSAPTQLGDTALLLSATTLLAPTAEPDPIVLSATTDLRLPQLQQLSEGQVSGLSAQRAGHLLWQLERTDTVVILVLHEVRLPEILSERSFAPGQVQGTAHLYAYPAGTPLGRVDFSATNSPQASSFSKSFSGRNLSLDLHANTQAALGSALQRSFPMLTTPAQPGVDWSGLNSAP